jgi:hypothetical protein
MAGGRVSPQEVDVDVMADLRRRIDDIERGYEFLLAYAAQGRSTDRDAQSSPGVRDFLDGMEAALERLGSVARSCVESRDAGWVEPCAHFLTAIDEDAKKAQAAIRLVLAQPGISSQLVDNLNASIHVRALLTDLFVLDEALKR